MALRLTIEQLNAYNDRSRKPAKDKVVMADAYTSNARGWYEFDGGKRYYLKSLWEINYAHYLEFLRKAKNILDWEYEPRIFNFPKDSYKAGPFAYKPDFFITNKNDQEWHEVKGWMNGSSKSKLKRFAKHFPDEKLTVIDSAWFKANGKHLRKLVPGWQSLEQATARSRP